MVSRMIFHSGPTQIPREWRYPIYHHCSLNMIPNVRCDVHEFFDLFISTLKAVLSEYHEVGAIVASYSPLNPRKRLMISFLESVFSVAACKVSRDVRSLHERRLRCRPSMYGQAISSTFASLIENQRSSHSKKTTKLRFRV